MKVIVDFAEPGSIPWSIVNDGVMGGRSTSKMEISEDGSALFQGIVSLENNGGFASTRAAFQSLNLSGYAGVILRVRGDGRRYQLRFRTDDTSDGVAYRAAFDTSSGEWLELKIRFADFQASFRVGYSTQENALYVGVEIRDESTVIDTTGVLGLVGRDTVLLVEQVH